MLTSDRGNLGTILTPPDNCLAGDTRSATNFATSSSRICVPSARTTYARGPSSLFLRWLNQHSDRCERTAQSLETHTATPMTAASVTFGFVMMRSSSSEAETWAPLTLIRSCELFSSRHMYTRRVQDRIKNKSATHLQAIENKHPAVFANKPKVARSQPPIGSKQFLSSGSVVVIAYWCHGSLDVEFAGCGRR